ncbi:hypothetical protein [Streptomyces sp. NPDC002564]|uniref:hypothetical protein n=1 Tax=Streptomyces sp. NPDC002564 TaxID=3364649 RepID=UPI00368CF5BD
MTTLIEPGIVEVTVVAQGSDPAMRVITHLANSYTTASGLECGLFTPGCVYRRLRVNTQEPCRVSPLLEDGEPYAGDVRDGVAPRVSGDQVHVEVEGSMRADVDLVRQGLAEAFPEQGSSVEVSAYGVSEPRPISVTMLLEARA